MVLFQWLPEVPNCCFSLPLKTGCIIIAICCILNVASALTHSFVFFGINVEMPAANGSGLVIYNLTHKYTCFEHTIHPSCTQSLVAHVAVIVFLVTVDLVLFVVSGVFLIGLCIEKPKTATIFMYTYSASKIPDLLLILFLLFAGLVSCVSSAMSRLHCFLIIAFNSLVAFYVLVVVKSYRSSVTHD